MVGPGVRRCSWWLAGGVAFTLAVAAVLVFVASGPPRRLEVGDQLASVAGLLVATAALLVGVLSWLAALRPPPMNPAVLLERAREELAQQVGRQWELESAARGLNRPEPLRVQWSTTSLAVEAAAAEVIGPIAGARAIRLRLHGDAIEMAKVWRQLPARRLVLIGAAGAGKTSLAVLLVRQLLADREPGGQVPVLLSLSGWNPRRQHLDTWLAWRLRELYPILADRDRFGADASARLVDQVQVVPVLDGLDELPAGLRGHAIQALTDAVGSDRPLVLTCRSAEYQDIVAAAGTPLARAAVLEVEPVTGAQAARYLPAGQVDGQRRWAAVVSVLKAFPEGPLAQALSTPLMVYLAQIAYTPPGTDPAELTEFPSADDVEKHLLSAYLPAVYAPRRPVRGGSSLPPLHDFPADKAQDWLAFLARHLSKSGSRDLAWWRLIDAVPRQNLVTGFAIGLTIGFFTGTDFALKGNILNGVVCGLLAALLSGLGFGTVLRLAARPLRPRPRRGRIQLMRLLLGLTAGLIIAAVFAVEMGPIFGILLGITASVVLGFVTLTAENDLINPRQTLRNDRTSLLAAAMPFVLLELLLVAVAGTDLMVWLLLGLITGLVLWLGFAWPRFALARLWLCTCGRLPWRLMHFLDDAHRRGVLRQVGAEYQFRHTRLHDDLAA
jgi:hypothetical protein